MLNRCINMVSRLVGVFSMIVNTDGSYAAPVKTYCDSP